MLTTSDVAKETLHEGSKSDSRLAFHEMISSGSFPTRVLQKMDVIEELSPSKETSKYVLPFGQHEEPNIHTLNISCIDERSANRKNELLASPFLARNRKFMPSSPSYCTYFWVYSIKHCEREPTLFAGKAVSN